VFLWYPNLSVYWRKLDTNNCYKCNRNLAPENDLPLTYVKCDGHKICANCRLPLLICMMGLPRSGKTTIVKELRKKYNAPVVRRDDIRLALHNQRYQAVAEPFVKAISDVMIRSLFLSGHEVVICDETNYSRATRDYHKSSKWKTVFYHVPTDVKTCQERAIATDQPDLVPVIQAMWDRYEPLGDDEERYEHE
jgi:tRNA uridine 5-carbamoylmethylation protein Kti12